MESSPRSRRRAARVFARAVRRTGVAMAGGSLLVVGVVMTVTPGPGLAAIVAGLAVLATEFTWAEAALTRARRRLHATRLATEERMRRRRGGQPPTAPV